MGKQYQQVTIEEPLKNDVRFPDYTTRDSRSAKSRQVWIARHRQSLES